MTDSYSEEVQEDEYEQWRANAPLLYDFVSETSLVWPSLTIEWLPQKPGSPLAQQELLLGTHTSDEEPNYLKIARIELPGALVDEEDTEPKSNIKIVRKLQHDKEVTRARYMPDDPSIIATMSGNGTVYIYSRDEASLKSTFKFHSDNGYGLDFSNISRGHLISGADDGKLALWDVNSGKIAPSGTWTTTHTDVVNDCKWHKFDGNMFGSVSEDKTLKLHDSRTSDSCTTEVECSQPFNTLAFSNHSQNLFAAAGTDKMIYLYDKRNIRKVLAVMQGHEDAITSLEFDLREDGILTSSGADKRVFFWDIKEIGAEQTLDDSEDGFPEVLFMHAGHRSAINDISVNPNIPWLMASVEEDNIVQVWKPSSKIPRIGGIPEVTKEMLL